MRKTLINRGSNNKQTFASLIINLHCRWCEIAKMLYRPPKHLLQFLFAELGTSGAIDGNNELIIKSGK